MKKFKNKLTFIIMFLIILLGNSSVSAGEVYLDEYECVIDINSDGSLDVTEVWDLNLYQCGMVYKSFQKESDEYSRIIDVEVTDITDSKRGTKLEWVSKWKEYLDDGEFYATKNPDGDFEIGIGSDPDINFNDKIYKIEYKVLDFITKGNDYADFSWTLISKEFMDSMKATSVDVVINLPDSANSVEDIYFWRHPSRVAGGSFYASDADKLEGSLSFNQKMSDGDLTIRVLFPSEIMGENVRKTIDEDILEKVKEFEKSTKDIEFFVFDSGGITNVFILFIIMAAIAITLVIYTFRNLILAKKIIDSEPDKVLEYYRDLPRENMTPLEAYGLINKKFNDLKNEDVSKIIVATILQLRTKGYLEIIVDKTKAENEDITINLQRKYEVDPIRPDEEAILHLLKSISASVNGGPINEKIIREYFSTPSSELATLIIKLNGYLEQSYYREQLVDYEKLKVKRELVNAAFLNKIVIPVFWIIAIFNCLFASFGKGVAGFSFAFISSMICFKLSSIAMVTSLRVLPLTEKGARELEKLKGLKKFIKDYSLLKQKEVESIEIWDKYLVYAVVFDISKEVFEQFDLPDFAVVIDMGRLNVSLFDALSFGINGKRKNKKKRGKN